MDVLNYLKDLKSQLWKKKRKQNTNVTNLYLLNKLFYLPTNEGVGLNPGMVGQHRRNLQFGSDQV